MLIVLPLVIIADSLVLAMAYQTTYRRNIDHCKEDVQNASELAAKYFEQRDPYDLEDAAISDNYFNNLCRILDMEYVYAQKLDVENESIQFLSIGFGDDATDKAKAERYAGVVVKGIIEEKLKAFTENKSVFLHQNNQFGNVLVCYTPVKKYQNSNGETVNKTVSIVGAEMSIDSIIDKVRNDFFRTVILVAIITGVIILMVSFFFKRKVSNPARLISRRMVGFVADREKGFEPVEVKGNDEFAEMASSFNSMAEEIDNYIENISELNREKTTREAEMNIARSIQIGILEKPVFRNENAYINAYMLPAKDVGGDLYDYKVLKDGKIFVGIADVSGKGMSAALLMARAVTLLHQYAAEGLSPGQILYEYNNRLAENNPNAMFITTFIGIYDPSTRELVYANAGHNPPYVLSSGLIELESGVSMAAGVFENEEYTENKIRLKAGDTLFMYTDGVTEAKNKNDKLFGDDALKQTLSENLNKSGEDLLTIVKDKVKEFADGAPRYDDITIITLTAAKSEKFEMTLDAKKENLTKIIDFINSLEISSFDKNQIRLIAEEIFINICSYAYEHGEGEAKVVIEVNDNTAYLTFTDSGKPFDPTKDVLDIDDYDVDNQIGGLGRFLSFEVADSYSYEYKDNHNILRLTKNIGNDD